MGKPPWPWVLLPCDLPFPLVTRIFPGLTQPMKECMKSTVKSSRSECGWIPIHRATSRAGLNPTRNGLLQASKAPPRQVETACISQRSETSSPAMQLFLPEAPFPAILSHLPQTLGPCTCCRHCTHCNNKTKVTSAWGSMVRSHWMQNLSYHFILTFYSGKDEDIPQKKGRICSGKMAHYLC